MYDDVEYEEWIIWNGALGLRDFVMIGRVEDGADGPQAWLDEPYQMCGPFSLDDLMREGQIHFAACTVMSRQTWQQEQAALRREAIKRQREAQQRMYENLSRRNAERRRRMAQTRRFDEREQRQKLELPVEGALELSEIKAAFRRLAKQAHPDVGGSHEHFVMITEARDALVECYS